jgi:thiamine biosynthesis lipoprotein
MGTTWSVRGFGAAEPASLHGAIVQTLDAIIGEMSQWDRCSDLSRFNTAPAGVSIEAPERLHDVLGCALEISAETGGAFDPTLGGLVDLWGFGPKPPAALPPRPSDIQAARAAAGWRRLQYAPGPRRLTQPGGLRLDLAGIAKGYAVDEIARLLIAAGVTSFLVEIGGELSGHGVKPDGQPWWVEIERPPGSAADAIVAALYHLSIATSGDYRRCARIGDESISHTIDPRTGRPVKNDLAAVTILHDTCMRADAYATALMALGAEAGLAFADARGLTALFSVRTARGVEDVYSQAFRQNL